jgi:hypothetical protein
MWSIFVPFNYACFTWNSENAQDNMEIHVREIQRATAAMGASFAVIGSIGDRRTESIGTVPLGHGAVGVYTTHSTTHAASVTAFAIAEDQNATVASRTIDQDAAAATLTHETDGIEACRTSDGPVGPGHAKITFASTGKVIRVELDPPYAGTLRHS